MIVTPALFALTLKVHMFAVAFEDIRAMAKPVQISMNVRAPKQMIVMLTPCAPTLKVLICVAVLESLKETGKLAQKS